MIKKLLITIIVILAVFFSIAALQPAEFSVVRSATIAAPPAAVFEQVNNFQNWNAWSPWAKLDPNAKNTFEGPPAGVGATFAWSGNSQVGEGKMTIAESTPNERVVMHLVFTKPFAASNTTVFTFQPEGSGTNVTWSMTGRNNFIGKCMSLVMDCDKMVGGQFEQGFSNLNKVVAGTPKS